MSQVVSQIRARQNGAMAPRPFAIADPLERVLKTSTQTAKPGQSLLMEGDKTNAVFVLLDGWLSLSKSLPDGEVQIVDFALPGEIIETCAANGAVSAMNIEALTDASVAVIPVPSWEEMKRQRPDLSRIARAVRAAAQARAAGRMLRLGRGKAVMRMAYALLELAVRLEAIGQSNGATFSIPMNQRGLGDFVGLSSVHVCRTLGQLANSGIIRTGGHMNVEILKPDQLAEMAGVDLASLRSEILAEHDQTSPPPGLRAYA